jgi:hypothetical protein
LQLSVRPFKSWPDDSNPIVAFQSLRHHVERASVNNRVAVEEQKRFERALAAGRNARKGGTYGEIVTGGKSAVGGSSQE